MGDPDSRPVEFFAPSDPGISLDLARRAATALLGRHPTSQSIEVALLEDDLVRNLNREWRGVDEPTDVLSFSAPDFPHAPLGTVAIALGVAARQAAARGEPWSLQDEIALLTVHGILHLFGYDDDSPEAVAQMDAETEAICREAGISLTDAWRSLPHEVVR